MYGGSRELPNRAITSSAVAPSKLHRIAVRQRAHDLGCHIVAELASVLPGRKALPESPSVAPRPSSDGLMTARRGPTGEARAQLQWHGTLEVLST